MGYDNLRLEKGMYRQEAKSFTQVLESLDPSENYRGTALEGHRCLPAAAEALRHQGKGGGFFSRGEVLPHHGFRRAVPGVYLPDRPAGHGGAGHPARHYGHHHRHRFHGLPLHLLRGGGRRQGPVQCGGGAAIPATDSDEGPSGEPEQAKGRMLVASYEAIRFQKLDLFP